MQNEKGYNSKFGCSVEEILSKEGGNLLNEVFSGKISRSRNALTAKKNRKLLFLFVLLKFMAKNDE